MFRRYSGHKFRATTSFPICNVRSNHLSQPITHIYGFVPEALVELPPGSVQTSPRVPGASPLGQVPPTSSAAIVVHAPASVVERRRVMALALRALQVGAPLTVIAHNTKGGTRLAKELEAFGCEVVSEHKRHHRIARTTRPEIPADIDRAIAEGDAILLPELGLWSQPGLFNWDRIDPGSQLLLDNLPALIGRGADLGCGIGVLARVVRENHPLAEMHLIDIDARALDISRRNVPGDGIFLHWVDVRATQVAAAASPPPLGEKEVSNAPPLLRTLPSGLDFVVCNPPFHDGGEEDRSLGKVFITRAAEMLRPGGTLWLTANRHLPYEAVLTSAFESVEPIADKAGFKIYAAKKAARAAIRKPGRYTGRKVDHAPRHTPGRAAPPKTRR